MRRKIFLLGGLMIIGSFGLIAFGQSSAFVEDLFKVKQSAIFTEFQLPTRLQETNSSRTASNEVPDNALWYIVFSMDEKLEKEAEKLNKEGRDGTLFSAYFRRQGKLSVENEKTLKAVSADFKKEIKPIDDLAKKIIDEARKKVKNGASTEPEASLLPPPPELQELKKQRNEVALRYRDLFKQSVGATASNQFSEFLAQEFSNSVVEIISDDSKAAMSGIKSPTGTESTETNVGITIIFYDDYTPAIAGRAETYLDYYTAYYYDPGVYSELNNATFGYTLNSGYNVGYANYQPAVVVHPNYYAYRGNNYCVQTNHYKVDAYNLSPQEFLLNKDIPFSELDKFISHLPNFPETSDNPNYAYYLGSSGKCHYVPVDQPCDSNSNAPCPQPTPTPAPAVSITPIDIVEKNNTKNVSVTVTNNASGSTTFSLRTVAGTGSATFADGSISMLVYGNLTNYALTIKGVTESSQVDNITIEAKFNNSATVAAHDEFTVATITALVFEQFDADYFVIDANPGNGHLDSNNQPDTNIGRRIFPDKNSPTDNAKDRALVKVIASVSPALPNAQVYFGSYDLDDPSANAAPIDTNMSDGNDNNGQVNGSKSGDFVAQSGVNCANGAFGVANPAPGTVPPFVSTINCTTAPGGTAVAAFKTTMQPGDNFAVAASLTDTYRDSIKLNSNDGAKLIDAANKTVPISGAANTDNAPAIRTEMLTVWRRLHIEVDSMGNVTGNSATGTIASYTSNAPNQLTFTLNVSPSLEPNRFENGRLVIGKSVFNVISYFYNPNSPPPVDANTANTVTVFAPAYYRVRYGDSFTLYDDDDFNSDDGTNLDGDNLPSPGEDVDEPDIALLTNMSDSPTNNVLAPAYIRPLYDLTGSHENVTFFANVEDIDITNLDTAYFTHIATESSSEFWTIYLLNAYQYDIYDDSDPSLNAVTKAGDGFVFGKVDALNGVGVTMFAELNREREYEVIDVYNSYMNPSIASWRNRPVSRRHTLAHEVGHLFDGYHEDKGLMSSSTDRTDGIFSDTTLNKMRGGFFTDYNHQQVKITHP